MYTVYSKDKPILKPAEELKFLEKRNAPFQGRSTNIMGLFLKNSNGNAYLYIAIDPFLKWFKANTVPSLYS